MRHHAGRVSHVAEKPVPHALIVVVACLAGIIAVLLFIAGIAHLVG